MKPEELWQASGLQGEYEAWAFGEAPDQLAELVRRGVKTATCSAALLYELEQEEYPKEGDYSVILDSTGNAVCIIRRAFDEKMELICEEFEVIYPEKPENETDNS